MPEETMPGSTASVAQANVPPHRYTAALAHQIEAAGKVRAKLEVPPTISDAELTERAPSSEVVQQWLAGRPVRKVVVRAPRFVNVVPG